MPVPIDITGQRFGMLIAMHVEGGNRYGRIWRFRCDCGQEVLRALAQVRHSSKNGKVVACKPCGRARTRSKSIMWARAAGFERAGVRWPRDIGSGVEHEAEELGQHIDISDR
jgi:hypothetical protein